MQFVPPGDLLVVVYQKAPWPRCSRVLSEVLQPEVTLPACSGCDISFLAELGRGRRWQGAVASVPAWDTEPRKALGALPGSCSLPAELWAWEGALPAVLAHLAAIHTVPCEEWAGICVARCAALLGCSVVE